MARSAPTATTLTREEARSVMLVAQGLEPATAPKTTPATPGLSDVKALIERLGVVQVDTISVAARAQYLTLWARLGPYDPALLDALLFPARATFEYWAHAASILPMSDYPYHRLSMLDARSRVYRSDHEWAMNNGHILEETLATIRARGPMASADFERPDDGRRAEAWDWFGLKESRRALHLLWTSGDLMVHSRRAGQKVYDLRERVLKEAYRGRRGGVPSDEALPTHAEQARHFARRTVAALGVVTPAWLWDYFRVSTSAELGNARALATVILGEMERTGEVLPVTIAGIAGPAYLAAPRMRDLRRIRRGEGPQRTTLLCPFDNLIWHRPRTRALWDYEVSLETYVVPEKRRYGYYCLAILHRGALVGRVDPKMDRQTGTLTIRALHLEPGITADDALLDGIADALADLARFLRAATIAVERSDPDGLAPSVHERAMAALRTRDVPEVGEMPEMPVEAVESAAMG